MTEKTLSDYQRLEKKIDDLSSSWNSKFDQIHGQFEKVGRLEERITAYMAIAERIESASQQDIRELNTKYADHEARLRAMEAIKPTDHEQRIRDVEGALKTANGRNKIFEHLTGGVFFPLVVLIITGLFLVWDRQRSGVQPPYILPSPQIPSVQP